MLSPPGSGEDSTGAKATLKGQVCIAFLEEAEMSRTMALALETGFPWAVLPQELHSAGPSPENSLQRAFPLIVYPEPHGSYVMQEAKMFWRKKNKGRKWRRPDGACVCGEGREPFQSLLVFPNFKV